MNNFILKGNICFSTGKKNLSIFQNNYVVCQEGICKGVFSRIPIEYQNYEIIDYNDKIIIPGMIDLHLHASQYNNRGINLDCELLEWLSKYIYNEESKFKDIEYAKKVYSLFVDELKKSATTRAVIFATAHIEATELLMKQMEDSGIVSYVGLVNMDNDSYVNYDGDDTECVLFDTRKWIENNLHKFSRTFPIITPRFIPSCTKKMIFQIGELYKTYKLPLQSHMSETLSEIKAVRTIHDYSCCIGEIFKKTGILDDNTMNSDTKKIIMAHCVYSPSKEIELLKNNKVFIAHCPSSNINLTSGLAPIKKYLSLDINVGLGTDICGGHSLSMFQAIVSAIQTSKMYYKYVDSNYKPLSFNEAFYIATKGGGKFFSNNVGSFEENYEFDALVLDDSSLKYFSDLSIEERLQRLIYLSTNENILAKYVKGKRIF